MTNLNRPSPKTLHLLRREWLIKFVSFFFTILLLLDPLTIQSAYALTSGPSQPEFSSFEPVATTNMVNEFTGDFTYNLPIMEVPGPEGSGYPLSLSYHSGTSPEEEASWVGYGWTLSPGAIQRNKKGLPDDFNGESVTHYNDVPKNWTVSVGPHAGNLEIFGTDAVELGINASLQYNSYTGYRLVAGVGFSIKGIGSLGYSIATDTEGTFNYNINPAERIALVKESGQTNGTDTENSKSGNPSNTESKNQKAKATKESQADLSRRGAAGSFIASLGIGSSYGLLSRNYSLSPTNVSSYQGAAFNVVGSIEATTPVPVGPEAGLSASYSQQVPTPEESRYSYGYLYSGNATESSSMDYYKEKEFPYHKRDMFLSIPFSNPDQYNVMGEGIGGSFRAHSKKAGHFFPNRQYSETGILNVGVEFMAGGNNGAGLDVGEGIHYLDVSKWEPENNQHTFGSINDEDNDEPYVFRFQNDLGGNFSFGSTDAKDAAVINKKPVIDSDIPTLFSTASYNETQSNQKIGRSSFIGYHTNGEMAKTINGDDISIHYNAYTKDEEILNAEERDNTEDGIGEFRVYNEDGMIYTYGLPVYAKEEKNMQYGFKNVPPQNISQRHIIHSDISATNNIHSKVGEYSPAPYATNYLLTSITSPDYIDRTLDGPTDDDFGSYTKFTYNKIYGGENWYHWRIPYTGQYYNPGELSNKRDDMGSFLSGDKEIYYLEKIETKTHYAIFETDWRSDGIGAANDDEASHNQLATSEKRQKCLKEIRLYSKHSSVNQAEDKLLQTVHFDYNYSLMGGLPNSTASTTGKLTLTRIFTEYEGIVSTKISPYEFKYEYPTAAYPAPYSYISGENDFSSAEQNPDYSPFNLDPWGSYQHNGAERHDEMRPWVDQTPIASQFDPAAWQLKQIILPSGGRIDIQYEQNEYQFVQDRNAMAMVRLNNYLGDNIFFLNINADLGPHTLEELFQLKALIEDELVDENERIYFKFLYGLLGNEPSLNDPKCLSEFVSGYAKVKEVEVINGTIMIKLGGDSANTVPRDLCEDYVKKQRSGNLNPYGNCDPEDGLDGTQGIKEMVMNLLGLMAQVFPGGDCAKLNTAHSYLRIPILKAKKGGGVRVKRLLMNDEGLEGQPVLYGKEYLYEIKEEGRWISSGVATNEPGKIREENPLITNLQKRTDPDWLEKIIAGPDKTNFEGLIGETILPAASVGYRQVIVRDIHTGKTNPGFTVKKFHTVFDYPFDKDYEGLKGDDRTDLNEGDKEWTTVPAGLFNYSTTNLWLTQGFSFVQTNYHGKPISIQTYAGDYSHANYPNNVSMTSAQYFQYFQPDEKIPISHGVDMYDIHPEFPGREMEVVFEGRKIEDISADYNVESDASIGIFGIVIVPFATGIPSGSYNESKLHTHVTTKITNIPAIVKRTVSFQDGVYSIKDNLAFSPENCRPLLTRTYDGFDGLNLEQSEWHQGKYYNYNFAAADIYPALRQKAFNEGRKFEDLNYDGSALNELEYSASSLFFPGDLISVTDSESKTLLFHVKSTSANTVELYKHSAMDNEQLAVGSVEVEILESGRGNRLNEDTGALTVYGESIIIDEIEVEVANARVQFVEFLNQIIQGTDVGEFYYSNGNLIQLIFSNVDGNEICDCHNYMVVFNNYDDTNGLYSKLIIVCFDKEEREYTCEMVLPRSSTYSLDHFTYNEDTENLNYYLGEGNITDIATCHFCNTDSTIQLIPGVVNVNISTYSDDWALPGSLNQIYDIVNANANPYETGAKGKWRIDGNYVYRENIIHGNDNPIAVGDDDNRIYKDAGTFTMELFNWGDLNQNDPEKWLKVNQTNIYSPNGRALEEEDIRGVKAAAKYGYDKSLPYLIAQNANYDAVYFEGFENEYVGNVFEEIVSLGDANWAEDIAHSGAKSLRLKVKLTQTYTSEFIFKPFALTQQIKNQGLRSQVWMRVRNQTQNSIQSAKLILTGASGAEPPAYKQIARVGEWMLYEVVIPSESFVNNFIGNLISPKLLLTLDGVEITAWNNGVPKISDEVWVDDFRYQPADAQMTCYVYDPSTYRLLTSFDDQHFGLYYQYNAQGQLVRKIVETERGMKTVQETQYNTPEKPKE